MDGGMPKIAYWTSLLYPKKEAVSREVFSLHQHFQPSFIYGLSKYYWFKVSLTKKYFGLNLRFYYFYRLLAPFLESRYDLNHIFGSTEDWHYLVSLKRKPIVLTAALPGKLMEDYDYDRIAHFVVECEPDKEKYLKLGLPEEKISVIYPGVPLISPLSIDKPGKSFRLLWNSAPKEPDNWEVRGLKLVFDLLKQDRSLKLVVIGRKWPTASLVYFQELVASRGLTPQVEVVNRIFSDLGEMYLLGDATIAPYKQDYCKPCPNSILESLAYGKPVLVSNEVGLAELISREQVGEVFSLDPQSFYQACEKLRGHYMDYQRKTQLCAEKYFSIKLFVKKYKELYDEVLN